jgi:hypothetical protein
VFARSLLLAKGRFESEVRVRPIEKLPFESIYG